MTARSSFLWFRRRRWPALASKILIEKIARKFCNRKEVEFKRSQWEVSCYSFLSLKLRVNHVDTFDKRVNTSDESPPNVWRVNPILYPTRSFLAFASKLEASRPCLNQWYVHLLFKIKFPERPIKSKRPRIHEVKAKIPSAGNSKHILKH